MARGINWKFTGSCSFWGGIFLKRHEAGDRSFDDLLLQLLNDDSVFSESLGERRHQLLQELQAA